MPSLSSIVPLTSTCKGLNGTERLLQSSGSACWRRNFIIPDGTTKNRFDLKQILIKIQVLNYSRFNKRKNNDIKIKSITLEIPSYKKSLKFDKVILSKMINKN